MNNSSAALPHSASDTGPTPVPLNGAHARAAMPMPPALTPPDGKLTHPTLFKNDLGHRLGLGLRNVVRRAAWKSTMLYALVRLRQKGRPITEEEFDLLVDGPMRSANTFAAMAFRLSQGEHFKVRSHAHAPVYTLMALKRRTPAVVLLRSPREALLSWIVWFWNNRYSIHFGLSAYIDYYKILQPKVDRLFVTDFEWVTTDFAGVVRALNRHSSLKLQVPVTNPEFLSRVEEKVLTVAWGQDFFTSSNPDPRRARFKKELSEIVDGPVYRRGLAQATELYEVFKRQADHCRTLAS